MRIKTIIPLMIFYIISSGVSLAQTISVKSPDNKYSFELKNDKQKSWTYSVTWSGKKIVNSSQLGFTLADGKSLPGNLVVKGTANSSFNKKWIPVYGEQNSYNENAKEVLVKFAASKTGKDIFGIRVRAYNEGVAFQYEFYNGDKYVIDRELTTFSLDPKSTVWVNELAQSPINMMKIADVPTNKQYERPLLSMRSDSVFVALGEAELNNFARMKFAHSSNMPGVLESVLAPNEGSLPTCTLDNSNNKSPWRFIMAAKSAPEILQHNYLVLNLNKPNQIKDTSWIKPGKVIREVSLTTQGSKASVDFCKRHNIQYILFDGGWYGVPTVYESDATTVTVDPKRSKGPLDMPWVIDYAKKNDVGVILYVDRHALERHEEKILTTYKNWGAVGVKYGFVRVGSQKWTNWLHQSVQKAAKLKLMVDVHDEYRPTGLTRTFPNFITQEGVRGDEASVTNELVLKTLFTRMIAGAADQTNCYNAERVENVMGSRASQMAKMVLIYSPWQFIYWYDRPQGSPTHTGTAGDSNGVIKENAEVDFYAQIPTVWDRSLMLEGFPGEYALVAREKNNNWYVGGLNGNSQRTYNLNFNYLDKNKKYEATIYSDYIAPNGKKEVKIEKKEISSLTKMKQNVEKMNGFAMIISPKK